ncbi:Autophagy-related protein 3 [Phaffia rhodozyma]|uniref:Ubiquitin-like-conjugating enzyme ATG10 n=1 Tax=Phaffia rhodozyma TaxID=264483 RepID=A0A0F7SRG8_PHARH|nr:Autophagy-related protein 3 [Phaffia rhodozyma]
MLDTPYATHADFAHAAANLLALPSSSSTHNLLSDSHLIGSALSQWQWRTTHSINPSSGYLVRSTICLSSVQLPTDSPSVDDPQQSFPDMDETPDESVAITSPDLSRVSVNVVHHVVYSPTYQTPRFLLQAYSQGRPLTLQELVHHGLIFLPSSSTPLEPEATSLSTPVAFNGAAEFPLLASDEHPSTGEAVWALHPCHTVEVVREIMNDAKAESEPREQESTRGESEHWLRCWLMVVGTIINLRL